MIPLELQRLFARLLLVDQQSASTADLTDSFGWNSSEVCFWLLLSVKRETCYFSDQFTLHLYTEIHASVYKTFSNVLIAVTSET